MCQFTEHVQPPCQCLPLQTSEMGDIHVYFIRFVAEKPDLNPVNYKIVQKCSTGSTSEQFITCRITPKKCANRDLYPNHKAAHILTADGRMNCIECTDSLRQNSENDTMFHFKAD